MSNDTIQGHGSGIGEVTLPVSFIPTPSRESVSQRNAKKAASQAAGPLPGPSPIPIPIPHPLPPFFLPGPRVLIWKQDPSVTEIGIRKAYLPFFVQSGPKDSRTQIQGMTTVNANANGDFIQTPGTAEFDSVHGFSIVTMTRLMVQRALGANVQWQWNTGGNVDPINVFPHAGVTMNAFYQRSTKSLRFFYFNKPGAPAPAPIIYTCRSLDIVAHETGHAVLDGLKPHWIEGSSTPQTGALHESFGDLTAIFVALSQMDQVEGIIAQTKGNLHDKNFLSDLAEEFGLALGRPNGLRNADNDLKLSQVTTEVHDLSQVFTGGIYDVLADIYAFERNASKADLAKTLYDTAQYLCSLLLRAIKAAPASNASFADVVNQMLIVANADGKPVQYRNFIRNRFTFREVVVSPTPLTADLAAGAKLEACKHAHLDSAKGWQNRSNCCGTMRHPEYNGLGESMKAETDELAQLFKV
ncbi:MAG: hypothetical protein HY286_19380 [Planctomycetes bacterium]|nr:hypothetical protein [Planctomycetota bacterium]